MHTTRTSAHRLHDIAPTRAPLRQTGAPLGWQSLVLMRWCSCGRAHATVSLGLRSSGGAPPETPRAALSLRLRLRDRAHVRASLRWRPRDRAHVRVSLRWWPCDRARTAVSLRRYPQDRSHAVVLTWACPRDLSRPTAHTRRYPRGRACALTHRPISLHERSRTICAAPSRSSEEDGQEYARNDAQPRAGSAAVFLEALSHVRRVALTWPCRTTSVGFRGLAAISGVRRERHTRSNSRGLAMIGRIRRERHTRSNFSGDERNGASWAETRR